MTFRHLAAALGCLAGLAAMVAGTQLARADETVDVGGSRSVLIKPASPRASVILMPGGNGSISAGPGGTIGSLGGNQLVRTRQSYAARGLAVLVLDGSGNLAAAIDYMAAIKRPVTVVATSRGTQRAAQGIAGGAKPDALVLTSGFLSPESGPDSSVIAILGSPSALPRTLVIHHREDNCRVTQPAGVDPFIKWSQGRARVTWLSGGPENGDPCEAGGHHGFAGLDGQVVGLAGSFH